MGLQRVGHNWVINTLCTLGHPCSSAGKESTCKTGDPGVIPGSGRSDGEGIGYPLQYFGVSLMAQPVKNLPAMQETWIWSLGWEDPLEKGMTTHSSILAWEIPWKEQPGWLQSIGLQRVGHYWATKHTHTHTHTFIGKEKKKLNWGLTSCFSIKPETTHSRQTLIISKCGTIWASVCVHECNSCQWFLHHWRNVKVFILAEKQPGVRSVSTWLLISGSPWRECSFKST